MLYKDMAVWKLSREVVEDVYRLTHKFPSSEKYGITSQLRRASVSVPSNFAEGKMRKSLKEYVQFIGIALGSAAEIECQLSLSVAAGLAPEADAAFVSNKVLRVIFMLSKIRRKLLKNFSGQPTH
jgi:four helix bundle protein